MPVVNKRGVLSGITVEKVMRRQLIRLSRNASVDHCINRMVKFKINSVLVTDDRQQPMGIVSKTDIVSAFYAGFPVETAIEHIMVGPLLQCFPDDELENAMDVMQTNHVHRLYVRGADTGEVVGVLAYPDVVGLLYRHCRACSRGIRVARRKGDEAGRQRLRVKEVMTDEVTANGETDPLASVIESLTAHRLGAVLIRNRQGKPVGVVSKSDLILAYKHRLELDNKAGLVMNSPVHSCDKEAELTDAIQQMLLLDVQRIFVHSELTDRIVGVVSLSDAARFRAGSCRACISSRMMVPS